MTRESLSLKVKKKIKRNFKNVVDSLQVFVSITNVSAWVLPEFFPENCGEKINLYMWGVYHKVHGGEYCSLVQVHCSPYWKRNETDALDQTWRALN